MSAGLVISMVIIALVICIIISAKTDVNGGVLALFAAWIIGCIFLGEKLSALLNYWPITVMFIFISTSLFFGVARTNGTFDLMVSKMLYKFGRVAKALPFIIFIISYIAAAIGAGAVGTQLILSPLIWALAKRLGARPILFMMSCWTGAVAGGGAFWAPEGASRLMYYAQTVGDEIALQSCTVWTLYALVGFFLVCVAYYFVFGGYKLQSDNLIQEKPEAFNPQQKKTLTVIVIAVLCILIPALLQFIIPNDITKALSRICDVQCVCLAGFVLCWALGLCGNGKEVVKTIPMDLILIVCGFSVLIKVAIDFQLPEILTEAMLGSNLPVFLIPSLFLLIAAFISVFSNFAVIYPLLMPMVPIVCASTGINSLALLIALSYGSVLAGFSPFSVGGASELSGCPDPKARQKAIVPMLIAAIVNSAIFAVLSMTGVFSLFPDPLVMSM